jgi:ribosome-associated toxin RatA of RatAB toxin-antitoxin module
MNPTLKSAYLTRGVLASLVVAAFGLLAPMAAAWTPQETARARGGEVLLRDLPASEGAAMQALFFTAAPPAIARSVLWDHARYAEFIPHARSSKVLEQHGNDAVLEQSGGQGPFSVSFVTRRHLAAHRITWTMLRGDLLRDDGSWDITPAPGGSMVAYEVHVVPKGPVPQRMTAYLQKQALPAMCQAFKQRIEAIAKAQGKQP